MDQNWFLMVHLALPWLWLGTIGVPFGLFALWRRLRPQSPIELKHWLLLAFGLIGSFFATPLLFMLIYGTFGPGFN